MSHSVPPWLALLQRVQLKNGGVERGVSKIALILRKSTQNLNTDTLHYGLVLGSYPVIPMSTTMKKRGFTLVELLVVIAIIVFLSGYYCRCAVCARSSASHAVPEQSQAIGIALHNHECVRKTLPPLGDYQTSGNTVYWSIQARLLPYVEQSNLHALIDFTKPISTQPQIARMRMPHLLCPSEVNDRERPDSPTFTHYPLNYGANAGLWHIAQPPRSWVRSIFDKSQHTPG